MMLSRILFSTVVFAAPSVGSASERLDFLKGEIVSLAKSYAGTPDLACYKKISSPLFRI